MGIKYKVNSNFFKAWSAEMSYVLGFISADGSLEDASYLRGKYLRIHSSDKEILEKIKIVMGSEHTIVKIAPKAIVLRGKRYVSKEKYMLRIGSCEIYTDLVDLGITPRKSKTIKLPAVPVDFAAYFIKGYLDGDGCISCDDANKRLTVTFTSGSKLFLEELSKMINCCLGLKHHDVFSNNGAFQIKYSTQEAMRLLSYVYSDCGNELYLTRKYIKFLEFSKVYSNRVLNYGVVPKRLRELSAKQLFTGSSPVHAFN